MTDSTDPLLPNAADMPPEDERLGTAAAERVIALFGGIRPMAAKLGVPVTTVQGWKKRGQIPPNRHEAIRDAAQAQGLALEPALLAEAGAEKESPAAVESRSAPAETFENRSASALSPESPPGAESVPPAPPNIEAPPEPRPRVETVSPKEPPRPLPSPPPAPPPRASNGLAAVALLVGLAALAAIGTRPLWEPRLAEALGRASDGPAGSSAELAALRAEIEQIKRTPVHVAERTPDLGGIENRLAALEAKPVEAPPLVDPAIAQRLTALEERVGAAADRLQTLGADLPPQIAAQRESLAQLTQQLFQTRIELQSLRRDVQGNSLPQLQAQARALMLMQLRAAIQTSSPFAAEMQAAVQQSAADPGLQAALAETFAVLEPIAPRGAPTVAQLSATLPPLIREQTRAGYASPEARWWERLLARLSTVLSVRPAPGSGGDSSLASALSQAEAALARDDLDGAIAAFAAQQSLPTPVETWIAQARDRRTLNAAQGPLGQGIVQALPRPSRPDAAPVSAPSAPVVSPTPAPAPGPSETAPVGSRLELPPMIGTPE